LEGRVGRQVAIDAHKVLIDQFIASFDAPPDELILDFDATDDPVHGKATMTTTVFCHYMSFAVTSCW